MITSRSNAKIVSNESVFYELRQADNTGILLRFTSNSFTEASALPQILPDDVPNNTLLYGKELKLLIPGCELCICFIYDITDLHIRIYTYIYVIFHEKPA